MALLNPAAPASHLAALAHTRLNWRLHLCVAGTLGFWIVLAQGLAHLL